MTIRNVQCIGRHKLRYINKVLFPFIYEINHTWLENLVVRLCFTTRKTMSNSYKNDSVCVTDTNHIVHKLYLVFVILFPLLNILWLPLHPRVVTESCTSPKDLSHTMYYRSIDRAQQKRLDWGCEPETYLKLLLVEVDSNPWWHIRKTPLLPTSL